MDIYFIVKRMEMIINNMKIKEELFLTYNPKILLDTEFISKPGQKFHMINR